MEIFIKFNHENSFPFNSSKIFENFQKKNKIFQKKNNFTGKK